MMRWMRRSRDLGIEGRGARWYDQNTRAHRMDEMRGYAEESAIAVADGARVLEIAPGPGYLSIELAKLGHYRITGLDISRDFVSIARRNAAEAGVDVDFQEGSVAAIPLADSSVDFIVCTAAFKNFREPDKALAEMHRVLKPAGTARIVDMDRNASNAEFDKLTRQMGVRGGEALFMKLMFKHFLRRGAYGRDEFEALFRPQRLRRLHNREARHRLFDHARKSPGRRQPSSGRASSGSMIGTPSRMG